jgi:hypothetical protein
MCLRRLLIVVIVEVWLIVACVAEEKNIQTNPSFICLDAGGCEIGLMTNTPSKANAERAALDRYSRIDITGCLDASFTATIPDAIDEMKRIDQLPTMRTNRWAYEYSSFDRAGGNADGDQTSGDGAK